MNLKKDDRWSDETISDYQAFLTYVVPKIFLKESVHIDVKRSFRVIEKLLHHSYYEYEFFDVAATKSLLTLELALKIRYHELTNEAWNRKTTKGEPRRDLYNLMNWFLSKEYFETTNSAFVDQVRKVRNMLAHPERFSYGGAVMRPWIEIPLDLINDVYEDVSLRLERQKLTNMHIEDLKDFNLNGCKLFKGSTEEVVYQIWITYIDNKETPSLIYLSLLPLEEIIDDGNVRKEVIKCATAHLNFNKSDNTLTFFDDYIESEIKIIPLSDESDIKNLSDFKSAAAVNFNANMN